MRDTRCGLESVSAWVRGWVDVRVSWWPPKGKEKVQRIAHLALCEWNVNAVSNHFWLCIDVHELHIDTLPGIAYVDLRRTKLSQHSI